MRILIMIYLYSFFCSCSYFSEEKKETKGDLESFKEIYLPTLSSTYKIKIINYRYVGNQAHDKYITELTDKWVPLAKVSTLTPTRFWIQDYCFYARKSEFKIQKVNPNTKCEAFDHSKANQDQFILSDLQSFNLTISGSDEIKIKNNIIPPYHFYFKISGQDQTNHLYFPFYSTPGGRIRTNPSFTNLKLLTPTQKFSSSTIQRAIPGMFILGLKEKKIKKDEGHFISKLRGTLDSNTLIKCHEANNKCQETTTYDCDHCRFGFFEAVGPCPYITTKYCGIDRCGQRNEPPCPRGNTLNTSPTKFCNDLELISFCGSGLIPVCNLKGIPICK